MNKDLSAVAPNVVEYFQFESTERDQLTSMALSSAPTLGVKVNVTSSSTSTTSTILNSGT